MNRIGHDAARTAGCGAADPEDANPSLELELRVRSSRTLTHEAAEAIRAEDEGGSSSDGRDPMKDSAECVVAGSGRLTHRDGKQSEGATAPSRLLTTRRAWRVHTPARLKWGRALVGSTLSAFANPGSGSGRRVSAKAVGWGHGPGGIVVHLQTV
jgi:hypothetical protein